MRCVLTTVVALLVCGGFSLVLAPAATADQFVYTYTGQPFTDLNDGYVCSPGPCEVQGSFTVPTQLFAGLTDATVTPTDWSFSDNNGNNWSFCGTLCVTGLVVQGIDTDSVGNITSWSVFVDCFGFAPLRTRSSGGTSEDLSIPGCHPVAPAPNADNMGMPGTWTCSDVSATGASSPCGAAPPAPTPEPSSSYLFAIGALVLIAAVTTRRLASHSLASHPLAPSS